jgi:hypothetical protein
MTDPDDLRTFALMVAITARTTVRRADMRSPYAGRRDLARWRWLLVAAVLAVPTALITMTTTRAAASSPVRKPAPAVVRFSPPSSEEMLAHQHGQTPLSPPQPPASRPTSASIRAIAR